MAAVFLDLDRDHANLDLLDDTNVVAGRTQSVAAVGAKLRDIVVRRGRELFERDQASFVFGMSGLSADVSLVLTGRRLGFGRLDDVGRRRFGGSRGVLAGSGQLCLELSDRGLELGNGYRQRIDLRLQAGAVGTGCGGVVLHATQPIRHRDVGKTGSMTIQRRCQWLLANGLAAYWAQPHTHSR
jgi:hypothetical protein